MINSISSQTSVPIPQSATPPPVKANTQTTATTPSIPAPYSPMKEKMESRAQEAKESATTKASEAMHALASSESSQVAASGVPSNPVVSSQYATQAYQTSTVPTK